jgi:DNA-binding GntR family transcriptional regulator
MDKSQRVLASSQSRKSEPRGKLSKQAYDALLEQLVTWRLQPGDILVEEDLAQKLGVSRTPAREALKALVAEGLLKVVPRTGYMVLPLTPDDVREIYDMRLLLEGEAAARTALRKDEREVREILEGLESSLRDLELDSSAETEPARVTFEQNQRFHMGIARASGSGRLAQAIGTILQDVQRVVSYFENPREQAFVARTHLDVLDDIRSGDAERARLAMQQHIGVGQSGYVQLLISRGSGNPQS